MVNGYARVRQVDNGADEAAEGWVRIRNISKIERKAGLPDLGLFAQMAIDKLVHREAELAEQNDELEQQNETISSLMAQVSQLQLAARQAHVQLQTTEAPTTTKEPPDGETPLAEFR